MSDQKEPLPLFKASLGDPNFDRVMAITSAMLTVASMDQQADDIDPALHTGLTMAAAGFFAGYLGGASIIAGTANEGDKRRMADMLVTNFRQGIAIGKSSAIEAMKETGVAGHA